MLAIRGFMDSEAGGAVGGMDADIEVKRRLAESSAGWKCAACGKSNGEMIAEVEGIAEAAAAATEQEEEKVPEELRLGYRDQLGGDGSAGEMSTSGHELDHNRPAAHEAKLGGVRAPRALPAQMPVRPPLPPPPTTTTTTRVQARPRAVDTAWLDKAIVGVAGALVFMIVQYLYF